MSYGIFSQLKQKYYLCNGLPKEFIFKVYFRIHLIDNKFIKHKLQNIKNKHLLYTVLKIRN